MARVYRKGRGRARGPQVVDKAQALGGHVAIEVPVSVAEIIEGASREAEQLAGVPVLSGFVGVRSLTKANLRRNQMPRNQTEMSCYSKWDESGLMVLDMALTIT
jgi:hypothetical protein